MTDQLCLCSATADLIHRMYYWTYSAFSCHMCSHCDKNHHENCEKPARSLMLQDWNQTESLDF